MVVPREECFVPVVDMHLQIRQLAHRAKQKAAGMVIEMSKADHKDLRVHKELGQVAQQEPSVASVELEQNL